MNDKKRVNNTNKKKKEIFSLCDCVYQESEDEEKCPLMHGIHIGDAWDPHRQVCYSVFYF
jgi:hypothetical protein